MQRKVIGIMSKFTITKMITKKQLNRMKMSRVTVVVGVIIKRPLIAGVAARAIVVVL
jgi:hypothetical protein